MFMVKGKWGGKDGIARGKGVEVDMHARHR